MTKTKTPSPMERPLPLTESSTDHEIKTYFDNYEHYFDSLFSCEDLQNALKNHNLPELNDCFASRKIAQSIAVMKDKRNHKEGTIFDQTTDEGKIILEKTNKERKAWEAVKTCIKNRIEAAESQLSWFKDRPQYGPEHVEERTVCIDNLKKFQSSMAGIEIELFIEKEKKRGHHGGVVIKDPRDVVNLFIDLTNAYQTMEKKFSKKFSKESLYKLIFVLLSAAGTTVDLETIKTIIKKNCNQNKVIT